MMRRTIPPVQPVSRARRLRGWFRNGGHSHPRRHSGDEPKRGWSIALRIMTWVALLDWSIKAGIAATLPPGGFHEIWEGRIAIWHVRNPAMMLGLWGDLPLSSRKAIAWLAAALAVTLLLEIIPQGNRLPPHRRPWVWTFAGLAFGGMLGNLGERALHWNVTDFLSVQWGGMWLPPANLADLALFAAMLLALPVVRFELATRSQRAAVNTVPEKQLPSPPDAPAARP